MCVYIYPAADAYPPPRQHVRRDPCEHAEARRPSNFAAVLEAVLGHLGTSWGPSGGHLGPSAGHLRAIWRPSWAILSQFWGHLGAILGHLGAIWGLSWAFRGDLGGHRGLSEAIFGVLEPNTVQEPKNLVKYRSKWPSGASRAGVVASRATLTCILQGFSPTNPRRGMRHMGGVLP